MNHPREAYWLSSIKLNSTRSTFVPIWTDFQRRYNCTNKRSVSDPPVIPSDARTHPNTHSRTHYMCFTLKNTKNTKLHPKNTHSHLPNAVLQANEVCLTLRWSPVTQERIRTHTVARTTCILSSKTRRKFEFRAYIHTHICWIPRALQHHNNAPTSLTRCTRCPVTKEHKLWATNALYTRLLEPKFAAKFEFSDTPQARTNTPFHRVQATPRSAFEGLMISSTIKAPLKHTRRMARHGRRVRIFSKIYFWTYQIFGFL